RFGRAEADIILAPIDQILQLHLHIGAALAGLGVLDLHGAPQAAFIFDIVAGTDVHAADLHGCACLSWFAGKSRWRPLAILAGIGKRRATARLLHGAALPSLGR